MLRHSNYKATCETDLPCWPVAHIGLASARPVGCGTSKSIPSNAVAAEPQPREPTTPKVRARGVRMSSMDVLSAAEAAA